MLKETPGSSSGRSCLDADVVEKITGVETEVRPTKGETDPREGLRTTVSHHEACANTMVTRFLFSWKALPFHNGQVSCAQLPQTLGMQHNQRGPVQCYQTAWEHHSHRVLTTCNNHSG